jgi:thiol-disulfide isomerase/thioredoxin
MGEAPEDRVETKRKRGGLRLALLAGVVVLAAGAGVLYATQADLFKGQAVDTAQNGAAASSEGKSDLARFATGRLAKLETPATLNPAPATPFFDRDGKETNLQAFKGKVVFVNVWATWCAPCVVEMPTVAALAQKYQGTDLVVAPISVDRDAQTAKSFIDVHEPLALYHDPKLAIPFALTKQGGMPQTVLIDRQGRIRAWYLGESDWNAPAVHQLVDALLAEQAAE